MGKKMIDFNYNSVYSSGPLQYLKRPTEKFGLLFEPIPVGFDIDRDSPIGCPHIEKHFDVSTVKKFEEIFLTVRDDATAAIEIGVDAYFNDPRGNVTVESSTSIIHRNKKKGTIYVGIDLNDKTRLNNTENNIFTIQNDSANCTSIFQRLNELGLQHKKVDFIYIDGYHSIRQVFIEWEYITNFLSKNGVALFHDTNYHPGSRLLFDAIDPQIFTTKKYFIDEANWGLGEIRFK